MSNKSSIHNVPVTVSPETSEASGSRPASPSLKRQDNDVVIIETTDPELSAELESTAVQPLRVQWLYWYLEFGACLLAFLSIVAISLTLYYHEGQPFPQWPLYISINSLVAVYAIVYKASLLFSLAPSIAQLQWIWFQDPRPFTHLLRFDEATRGPWGSLQLIWAQKLRQPLAILGAFITIAAVIVDPFFQELAQTTNCSVSMVEASAQDSALLSRSNLYQADTYEQYRELQRAVNGGTFGAISQAQAQCPTGNCTFSDVFSTIGFCSSCEDISDQVQHTRPSPNSPNASSSDWWFGLPSGPSLKVNPNTFLENNIDSNVSSLEFGLVPEYPGQLPATMLVAGGDYAPSSDQTNVTNGGSQPAKSIAATCTLDPCVREYNATVKVGQLEEQLISQSEVPWGWIDSLPLDSGTLYGGGILDLHCISSKDEAQSLLTSQNMSWPSPNRWLPMKYSPEYDSPELRALITSALQQRCLFLIDTKMFSYLTLSLEALFWGTMGARIQEVWQGEGNHPTIIYYGPAGLDFLYDDGRVDFPNIRDRFAAIAEAVTWNLRSRGVPAHSAPAVGRVEHYATCLEVHWGWIVFPVVLAALKLIMLLWTVAITAKLGLPHWKGSPLVWHLRGPGSGELYPRQRARGVDDSLPPSAATTATAESVEKASKKITVVLRDVKRNPRIELAAKDEMIENEGDENGA